MHFDCRVVWPDASVHWIEMHGSVLDDGGRPGRMLGTVTDITERKRIEAVLRDADHRKDEFLATLAHELRNPLAPIRNSLHIIRLSKAEAVHDKAHAVIERQLDQLVHLVDDLLDVSRISQGKIELRRQLIDMAAVVDNAVDTSRPLIDAKRHRLTIRMPVQPLIVDADMTRLTQVISNLLNNAAKYTPDEGCITLEATRTDGIVVISVTRHRHRHPGRHAAARVRHVHPDQPHARTVAGRARASGWRWSSGWSRCTAAASSGHSAGENRGATITLRLPAAELPAGPDAAAPPDVAAAGTDSAPVLVVDDNSDVADSLSELLRLVGYRTVVGRNGKQALELAERERPHIALLDIGLPDISGHEVARRLRRRALGAADGADRTHRLGPGRRPATIVRGRFRRAPGQAGRPAAADAADAARGQRHPGQLTAAPTRFAGLITAARWRRPAAAAGRQTPRLPVTAPCSAGCRCTPRERTRVRPAGGWQVPRQRSAARRRRGRR